MVSIEGVQRLFRPTWAGRWHRQPAGGGIEAAASGDGSEGDDAVKMGCHYRGPRRAFCLGAPSVTPDGDQLCDACSSKGESL